MPILKDRRKGDFVKVYRPNGSRLGRGEYEYQNGDRTSMSFWSMVAIERAFQAFLEEFGHMPKRDTAVIEVVFTSYQCIATVYELKEG